MSGTAGEAPDSPEMPDTLAGVAPSSPSSAQPAAQASAGPAAKPAASSRFLLDTAPSGPAASPSSSAPSSSSAALQMSEWTRRAVAMCAMLVVSLCVLGAVGAMVYRTIVDGNAPLTNDITTKLTWIAGGGFAAMTAALFGSNSIITKLIDKLL